MSRLTPILLAASAGLVSALAHPPVGAWPLVFVPPLLLLLALDRADVLGAGPVTAGLLGGVAGIATFAPMLSWLIVPAGTLGWLALTLAQSLFVAVLALALWPFVAGPTRLRPLVVLAAPILWTGVEAWRGAVPLGGFGWGNPMYAHVDGSWMLPMARVLGGHGLTLFTAACAVLVYDAVRRLRTSAAAAGSNRLQEGLPAAQRSFVALTGVLLVSVVVAVEPPPVSGAELDVLAVQGNDREPAGDGGRLEDLRIADRMLELTTAAVAEGGVPELTVWPENSVDRDPTSAEGADLAPVVDAAAAVVGGGLMIGTRLAGPRPGTFHNAAVLLDAQGTAVGRYDKRTLVPFGEFVPWRDVLGRIPALRQVPEDGIAGDAAVHLEVSGVAVAPAICFETLFPELVRDNVLGPDGDAAGIVVMSTNDASFGRSAESAQHLAQSRLRAVETGRWVVHAALSGSTAIVDPRGGVHAQTELYEATTVRARVPVVTGTTPFLAIGDVVGRVARWLSVTWIFALVVAAVGRQARRRGRPAERP